MHSSGFQSDYRGISIERPRILWHTKHLGVSCLCDTLGWFWYFHYSVSWSVVEYDTRCQCFNNITFDFHGDREEEYACWTFGSVYGNMTVSPHANPDFPSAETCPAKFVVFEQEHEDPAECQSSVSICISRNWSSQVSCWQTAICHLMTSWHFGLIMAFLILCQLALLWSVLEYNPTWQEFHNMTFDFLGSLQAQHTCFQVSCDIWLAHSIRNTTYFVSIFGTCIAKSSSASMLTQNFLLHMHTAVKEIVASPNSNMNVPLNGSQEFPYAYQPTWASKFLVGGHHNVIW